MESYPLKKDYLRRKWLPFACLTWKLLLFSANTGHKCRPTFIFSVSLTANHDASTHLGRSCSGRSWLLLVFVSDMDVKPTLTTRNGTNTGDLCGLEPWYVQHYLKYQMRTPFLSQNWQNIYGLLQRNGLSRKSQHNSMNRLWLHRRLRVSIV